MRNGKWHCAAVPKPSFARCFKIGGSVAAVLITAATFDLRPAAAQTSTAQDAGNASGSDSPGIVRSAAFPGVTCQELSVPMRDGTSLSTFLYLPDSPGKYPVLMMRNPYGRVIGTPSTCFNDALGAALIPFAQDGYAGVVQEVRGTYTSEGRYYPVQQEADDGFDAIEWAAAQDWSNGKVGMMGPSYLAITQWQPAGKAPPHLVAIAPSIMGSDQHDNVQYVNAVFDLWLGLTWPGTTILPDQITRAGQANGLSADTIAQQVTDWTNLYNQNITSNWVKQLPLTSFSEYTEYAPFYYDWLRHPNYDRYWARVDTSIRYPDIQVPALVSGDWYDPFQIGTVQNFRGMRAFGATPEARSGTRLIMGAYGHSGNSGTPTFGDDTPDPSLTKNFFDYWLKGVRNGEDASPTVNLYVLVPPNSGQTGTGFWITGSDFPLPGTQPLDLFLTSGGHANTREGDGKLTDAAQDSTSDSFDYDPANPVPTVGGNMCCDTTHLPAGAQEQSSVEMRDDVLVYSGDPVERDTPVIGMVTANFWAISSAPDTDFTVKLVDVHPDGNTHNVLDRIVRARYRNGSRQPPQLIEPGQAYQYTLDLGNTATIIRAGHRLRVEISSSNFPHFARNLNTAENPNFGSQYATAHQTILHDTAHPSYLALPVNTGVSIPSSVVAASSQ